MNVGEIRGRMLELEKKEKHDARDLAIAQELMQRYMEHLENLENNTHVKESLGSDAVADKVLSFWYKET